MKKNYPSYTQALLLVLILQLLTLWRFCNGFASSSSSRIGRKITIIPSSLKSRVVNTKLLLSSSPSSIEPSPIDDAEPSTQNNDDDNESSDSTKRIGINSRGAKMNEIDFTLAPTDVSLSRCYQMIHTKQSSSSSQQQISSKAVVSTSLTRALNTASNRAVRRILLARSWPSAEALNLSLRTVLLQQQQKQQAAEEEDKETTDNVVKAGLVSGGGESDEEENDKMKCPVPRPILNILTKKPTSKSPIIESGSDGGATITKSTSKDREQIWITNQLTSFYNSYSTLEGYDKAEAYLESILVLATSGVESERVAEFYYNQGEGGKEEEEGSLYVAAYQRILSVIQSVGAVLIEDEEEDDNSIEGGDVNGIGKVRKRRRIGKKLNNIDICLSMLDKVSLANERKKKLNDIIMAGEGEEEENLLSIPYDAAARLAYDSSREDQDDDAKEDEDSMMSFEEFKKQYEVDTVAQVSAKWKEQWEDEDKGNEESSSNDIESNEGENKGRRRRNMRRIRRLFWRSSSKDDDESSTDTQTVASNTTAEADGGDATVESSISDTPPIVINPDDLGGVLLSAEEPTMTRQLNVLSNIIQRTLIFGGDQELLVLAETLDADKPAFIQRWYKKDDYDSNVSDDIYNETRPGVQYLNSLIQLLRDCYTKGVLNDVTPTLPLSKGYQNAYGRLAASLIELGSGYVRVSSSSSTPLALSTAAAARQYLKSTAPPKTAAEELGRFVKLESAVRKNSENPYPDDLVGVWDVEDVVGFQIIGSTEVTFKPRGKVSVKPPMQGLRWRLDPGPTHLDTCTFQVLSDDGAILQYKGFVDRGSRLEARVSKRSLSMRGAVSFLMRDADGGSSDDYYSDMVMGGSLKSGTTKFIMSRNVTKYEQTSYSSSSTAGLDAGLKCSPIAEGEREIVTGPNGPILVTKVAGTYYAVDATCPHLNLPMKKGKITVENGQPTLTCSFHNSCFEMKSGKCTKWVTGALGNENEFISGVMSSLGSEQKDITAYQVSEENDGSLTITSETKAPVPSAKIAA